jgi:hypothetical protein
VGKLAEMMKIVGRREPAMISLNLDLSPSPKSAVASAPLSPKSLRDQQAMGANLNAEVRTHVSVFNLQGRSAVEMMRKQNVLMLRRYAEHSVWVRAAIKCYRDSIGRAKGVLKQVDPQRPMNERVRREVAALFAKPNLARTPYRQLKEEFVEDYLVIGHGALELTLRKDTLPNGMRVLDAARVGMVKGWDGTDRSLPRYVLLDKSGRASRFLADEQVMCLVNCSRSYDELGLSHVEVLDLAVRVLLQADEQMLKEVSKPMPSGALNLGAGATKGQVEQVRNEMSQVEHPFVVLGGTESMSFVRFDATAAQIKRLDQCTWYVRQVAAIFGVSTAKLRLAVDTSRANTEAMFDDDLEGPGALLENIAELENAVIVQRWGDPEETNLMLDYPIMNRKSEKEQAGIGQIALGNQPWRTINEVRRNTGDPEIESAIADEILLNIGGTLIPLSTYEEQLSERTKPPVPSNPPAPPNEDKPSQDGGGATEDGNAQDKGESSKTSEKGLSSVKWTEAETLAAATFQEGDAQRMFHYLASVAPDLAGMFVAKKVD